jgi:hypothetical protein
MERMTTMHFEHKILSRRKLATSIAAGAGAIALGTGGAAIADVGSSNAVPHSANAATVSKCIPFHRGKPSPAKVVGHVPANWKAGKGTIITGTAATKAKAAARAAYRCGTINRVVRLSNGDYNVHVIGVNWPHHVFVSKKFKVLGAL